jgi:DMSO reductase anchor subunit
VKPALSVVFFTTSSGAGLGLACWLLLAQLGIGLQGRLDPSHPAFAWGVGLAFFLVTAGLLASTQHLANPRNAWRALARFRSSWLSREGVLAVLWYPLGALHLWASLTGASWAASTAVLLTLLSVGIVICTAMIYACLKTIPRWRTWHTLASYLLFAAVSGGLLWLAVCRASDVPGVELGALLLGAVMAVSLVKLAYYAKFSARVTATLNQAIGVPLTAKPGQVQGRVRLLDAGHSHGTFLTDEFGFQLGRERARTLRGAMFVLTAIIPVLAFGWADGTASIGALGAAALAVLYLAGVLIERWMFFAQAEHVVRLYHGQSAV